MGGTAGVGGTGGAPPNDASVAGQGGGGAAGQFDAAPAPDAADASAPPVDAASSTPITVTLSESPEAFPVTPSAVGVPNGTYTLAVTVLDAASNTPALRFANTNYYRGGRAPLGRVAVGTTTAPSQDLGAFDLLKPDTTLSY